MPGSAASRHGQSPVQPKADTRVYAAKAPDGRTAVLIGLLKAERRAKFAAPVYVTSPHRVEALRNLLREAPGAGTETQCARLLRALPDGITTYECSNLLDVSRPGARLSELRRAGYEFAQTWVLQASACGALHRVYLYRLHRAA